MSGFTVAYGNAREDSVDSMLERISHRGPFLKGKIRKDKIIMAQNYLKAEAGNADNRSEVPVKDEEDDDLWICYDGQIGNVEELCDEYDVTEGPFREERLLLSLYKEHGPAITEYLDDAIFAFVISDGQKLLAARDPLGIKTLYYGKKDGVLFLSSELKGLSIATDDINEFPAASQMTENTQIEEYSSLPEQEPKELFSDLSGITQGIRDLLMKSIKSRVVFNESLGSLLSGGLDSSIIAALAAKLYREQFGENAKLPTFAIGVAEGGDIENARIMAEYADTDHHELIVSLDEMIEALPEVIYYLESFDPSLVRSSVANYFISRFARKKGIEVLLSGEGGDELFCGYEYMKQYDPSELFSRQIEVLKFLHNNASLRLDRMNECNSIKVVAPLISGELLDFAFHIPGEYKIHQEGDTKVEKWIFRKAFEDELPEVIAKRIKQEFSQGSGSADLLSKHFDDKISDNELKESQSKHSVIRSKEELYYFRIFADHFGEGKAVQTVGQWVSAT